VNVFPTEDSNFESAVDRGGFRFFAGRGMRVHFMTSLGLRTGSQSPHPKSKFTPAEDIAVISYVREHGTADWPRIARLIPGRNARQCKDRWCNFLSPDVVNGPWTDEEESLLCNKFAALGNSWKLISSFFQGRTEINVKSHWQMMQRRIKREITQPPSLPQTKREAPPPPNTGIAQLIDLDDMPMFGEATCDRDFDAWPSF
jgi:hypothetical protein